MVSYKLPNSQSHVVYLCTEMVHYRILYCKTHIYRGLLLRQLASRLVYCTEVLMSYTGPYFHLYYSPVDMYTLPIVKGFCPKGLNKKGRAEPHLSSSAPPPV